MPFIIFLIVIVLLVSTTIRIVPEACAMVVERLGRFHSVWRPGIHFLIPFADRIAKRINLKEQVADFPPQPVITKDNVTMRIDSVVFFVITDSKLYAYGVENPIAAIENLTATTLRNIIGSMDLDTTLTSRDEINTQMRSLLDVATDPWGIKVNRVELKNILPPDAIREAMEKQMKAEREKREAITLAEGNKEAAIRTAQGNKEAAILNAEADKKKVILAAEAQKEKEIQEAEGRAQAILNVQRAEAEGIRLLKEAGADDAVLRIRSLETFAKVSNGKATKIIIPSDIQNMAGLLSSLKETLVSPSAPVTDSASAAETGSASDTLEAVNGNEEA
ncbi:SPFH domain-containing protein [Oribacterium sp.]